MALALCLLALGSVVTSRLLVFGIGKATTRDPAGVSWLDARHAPARAFVRPGEHIGFDSGQPVRIDEFPDAHTLLYYTAQYGLAPALVERDPALPKLLLVLGTDLRLQERIRRDHLEVLVRLAPGMALVEHRTP